MSSARAFVPRPLRQGVVTQKVDGETLLYVERTHQASCLNAPAARIWALCDGERTVGAIAAGAGLEPEVVAHALGHFANAGLLENTPNQIPIVLMVMAPEARAAASNCIKPMQPCTDASLCCSGECVLGLCG